MQICPNCGQLLQCELIDGLTHCSHCNQVVDSSDYNKLLSAAWQVRKKHLELEQIKIQLKLDDDLCIFVYTFIFEYNYTHQEFMQLLRKLGVSRKGY